jgi:hypothetical protein
MREDAAAGTLPYFSNYFFPGKGVSFRAEVIMKNQTVCQLSSLEDIT